MNEKGNMGVEGVKLGKETEPEMRVWNGAVGIMTINIFFLSRIAKIRL